VTTTKAVVSKPPRINGNRSDLGAKIPASAAMMPDANAQTPILIHESITTVTTHGISTAHESARHPQRDIQIRNLGTESSFRTRANRTQDIGVKKKGSKTAIK